MAATLMDGKALAERVRAEVAEELVGFGAVGLATVLVGEDPASEIYIRMKHKAAGEVGITSYDHHLPADTGEDRLKALGAAAASSGAVAMFHAVDITPEAPTLGAALGGLAPNREIIIRAADLRAARDELTTSREGPIGAVSVGTPHLSAGELAHLERLVSDARPSVPFYANAGRDIAADATTLARAGVTLVTDTCTYITPIIHDIQGPVMTNSAKWAWYAPANLGFDVVFGSLEECVRSAALGRVWRDPELWGDEDA